MSAYECGHLALMRGFFLLGCMLAAWLAAIGLCALWRAIKSAPEAHEDRGGFHPEGRS
jgi:type II secretory pathway component PulJ